MKKWWQSKTILASLITTITIIVGIFDEQLSSRLALESSAIVEILAAGTGIVGTGLAIYGRVAAKDDIVK